MALASAVLLLLTVSALLTEALAFSPWTTLPWRICSSRQSCCSALGASGPRGEARRAGRERRTTTTRRSTTDTQRRRAPHQFDHTKEEARPFVDTLTEIQKQRCNEDAPPYDLVGNNGDPIRHAHLETRSLDDLFPNLDFSKLFANSTPFRTELRSAMRRDIFHTTPAYRGISEKAQKMLLLPDSSLQGSWKCRNGGWSWPQDANRQPEDDDTSSALRMEHLTEVLSQHLGPNAPSGDDFMDTLGSLCGSKPSTHWIDIVGIVDRRIPHSFHQDTGKSPTRNTKTVLLGFPAEDNYDGVGVFSHLIELQDDQWAAEDHPLNEPVLYSALDVDEEYIVRPRWAQGREILLYRDVDVLHSAPDVAYRESVMRFM